MSHVSLWFRRAIRMLVKHYCMVQIMQRICLVQHNYTMLHSRFISLFFYKMTGCEGGANQGSSDGKRQEVGGSYGYHA